jgi:probable rRNA maturation factor
MILIEPDAHVLRSALPKRELSRFLLDARERVGLQGKVTVLLTTDEHMRELNRTFRRKNQPTDVLSFPAAPASFAGEAASGGDLAISVDMAREQAQSLGHTMLAEVKILILHGLLHLSGLDHEQDTGQMGRRESRLRREFGLPAGLIQRTAKAGSLAVSPTSQKQNVGRPVPHPSPAGSKVRPKKAPAARVRTRTVAAKVGSR